MSARLGLTTGSVTAMLDRLERRGYLTRSPDPSDRRKVLVHPTPEIIEKVGANYGPLAEAGFHEVARYTPDELELLIDFMFMRRSRRLQEEHLAQVRGMPAARRPHNAPEPHREGGAGS